MQDVVGPIETPPVTGSRGGKILLRVLLVASLLVLLPAAAGWLNSFWTSLAVIFASSVCGVVLYTPIAVRLAHKLGAIDIPRGRHAHEQPTPRLGGLAIWFGVMLALVLTSMHYMPNLRALLICSTLMLAVGAVDDVIGVSAAVRILVQLGSCAFLIADGVHVTFLPPTAWGVAGEWVITAVWIVGITNAINFLDGIDGLVSGMVVGTSLMYFLLALLLGSSMLAYCSVALMGACLAFLAFNFKPARIFMGDGGSSFLGFFLATLSVQGGWAKHNPLVSFFIPILLLSVPIYDMVFTTVARIASGRVRSVREWLEYTGRDHIHHRLGDLGLSKAQVMLTICFLNLTVGLGAVTLFEARTYGGVALIIEAIGVYVVFALLEVLAGRKKNGPENSGKPDAHEVVKE